MREWLSTRFIIILVHGHRGEPRCWGKLFLGSNVNIDVENHQVILMVPNFKELQIKE
jgi:hypothetical protein